MNSFLSAFLKKLGIFSSAKTGTTHRALSKTEASEQKANEEERLDRLRNPGDYRGR